MISLSQIESEHKILGKTDAGLTFGRLIREDVN